MRTLTAGLAAAAALAAAPAYPAQHAGSGREPTKAAGTFAGKPFVARSALVRYEIGLSCCPSKTIGEVVVYLLQQQNVTCKRLDDARSEPNFSYSVDADGKALPVGRAVPDSIFQQASFNVVGLTTGFQIGIRIIFTRIDTSAGKAWHGRVLAPRARFNGKTYAMAGTFAARWCGTVRP